MAQNGEVIAELRINATLLDRGGRRFIAIDDLLIGLMNYQNDLILKGVDISTLDTVNKLLRRFNYEA